MSIAQILNYQVEDSTLKTYVNNQYHSFWDQPNNRILNSSLPSVQEPVILNATNLITTPEIHTTVISRNSNEPEGITFLRDILAPNNAISSSSLSVSDNLAVSNGFVNTFKAETATNSIYSETACNMYGLGNISGYNISTGGATFSNNLTVSNTITDAVGSIGSEGQVLTSGAGNTGVYWSSINADIGTWSSYPALSQVNLNNYGITGATTIYSNNLQPNYRQTNTYFVSPSGSDTNNNGTFEAPYATLSKCLQITEALTALDNVSRTIHLSSGTYTEDVNINYNVNILGDCRALLSTSISCQIVGTVNINLTSSNNSLFQNIVLLDGVLITGKLVNSSSADSVLNINNCFIYSPNDISGRAIYYNPTSNNTRFRLTNSTISSGGSNGTSPLIEITNGGSCSFNQCQITSKGVQNVLKLSGTATISSISNCIFTSDTTSASAPSIVYITTVNSNVSTFSNCAFVYSSNTNKSANSYASGICCESTLGNPTVMAIYNTFVLQGTNGSNYAIQDIKHATATQMNCLYFSNNASLGNASSINGNQNQNKFALTTVS